MQGVSKFVPDQKAPYNIELELKIRKLLEELLSDDYEMHRNEDPYAWDIVCYKYKINGDSFIREELGFIEVEVSKKWSSTWPGDWKTYSYLRRKVEENDPFNNSPDTWKGAPAKNAHKTIYLKCSLDMSDCHAALVSDIYERMDGNLVCDHRYGFKERQKWYVRFPLDGCEITRRGWEEAKKLIEEVFS